MSLFNPLKAKKKISTETIINVPKHVAIIMDGNGRWAKKRGKIRVEGHRTSVRAVRESVTAATRAGVKQLTLFAFSCENWQRPEDEVNTLMELFYLFLDREVNKLHKNNIKLRVIGDKTQFSEKLQKRIAEAEARTENNERLILNVAANYSGQWDIVQTCRHLIAQSNKNGQDLTNLDPTIFSETINSLTVPEVDLMIRTGGESRISNFMLWQMAYAELYFVDILWPDFRLDDFNQALVWYNERDRRFGTV